MPDTESPSSAFAIRRLQEEVSQGHSTRRPLYQELEKNLGKNARLVAFFTSFRWPVLIQDNDADMLEEVLQNTLGKGDRLVLLLNSPGGEALAAERIVNVCQSFGQGEFSVIVPKMAKSAATMVCLGATEVGMSLTSELGPIDPQIPIRDDQGRVTRHIAAHEIRRSFDKLVRLASSTKGRIEPFLQQLSRYDSREIEWIISQQELSESIALKLLKSGTLRKLNQAKIKAQIKPFLDPTFTKVHGRPIYHDLAKKCGLKMKLYDLRSPFWRTLWGLYARIDHLLTSPARGIAKLIESADESYSVSIPVE